MSNQRQRGRKVEPSRQTNPLNVFYIILGVIAVVGTVVVITLTTGGRASSSDTAGEATSPSVTLPTPAIVDTPAATTADSSEEPAERAEPADETEPPVASSSNQSGGASKTTEGFYYKGDPNAPVTVVEYSDFQCPACAFHNQNLLPRLMSDYIETGKIRLIFHDFPLNIHPHAAKASEAAHCAGDQSKFWEMHELLFQQQEEWASKSNPAASHFGDYAAQIGLDTEEFMACLNNGTYSQKMAQAYQSILQVGISATPTFVVDGKKVEINQLFNEIDAALAAKSAE